MIGARSLGANSLGNAFYRGSTAGLTITIGGRGAVAECYAPGSLRIRETLGARSTCSFQLIDTTGGAQAAGPAFSIIEGEEILIENNQGVLFGGRIDATERVSPGRSNAVFTNVTCVDHTEILDRHRVSQAFTTPEDEAVTRTLRDVVEFLHENYLEQDGVKLGTVEIGPLIRDVRFSLTTVTQALDALVAITGGALIWRLDYLRQLHVIDRQFMRCPVEITAANEGRCFRRLDVSRDRRGLRTVQTIIGGNDTTDTEVSKKFKADGEESVFTLHQKIAAKPRIIVNGGEVSPSLIGITGVDPNAEWTYEIGERSVEVNTEIDDVEAPVEGTLVEVRYRALFPIQTQVTDLESVADRQAVEGGSGIYHHVLSDRSLEDGAVAVEKANALLDQYGDIPEEITLELDASGVEVGQTISIDDTPELGVVDDYTIQQVSKSDLGGQTADNKLRVQCRATTSKRVVQWVEFYRRQVAGGESFDVNPNDQVISPLQLADVGCFEDSVSHVLVDPLNPGGGGSPTTTTRWESAEWIASFWDAEFWTPSAEGVAGTSTRWEIPEWNAGTWDAEMWTPNAEGVAGGGGSVPTFDLDPYTVALAGSAVVNVSRVGSKEDERPWIE